MKARHHREQERQIARLQARGWLSYSGGMAILLPNTWPDTTVAVYATSDD